MVSIYFATADWIYKVSEDDGAWTIDPIEVPGEARSIAFDEVSGRLFAGTFNDGLYGSDNDGESWQRLGEDALHERVMSIAVSRTEQLGEFRVIWAGTEPSMLYRSGNGGLTWTECSSLIELPSEPEWSFPPRPETHHVRTIQPDLHDADKVFVGIELGGVMRSLDGGESWEDRKPGSHHDSHSLRAHPFMEGRIYEAAGEGFAESFDGGDTWRKFNDGLGDYTYMVDVAADPGDADTMIASVARGPREAYMPERAETRLVRRSDGGAWDFIDAGLPEAEGSAVFGLLTDSEQPGVFYAVNNTGIYVSRDAGRSFEKLEIEWPEDVRSERMTDAVLVR